MHKQQNADAGKTEQRSGYTIQKQTKSRFWEVHDPAGELVCLTVYRATHGIEHSVEQLEKSIALLGHDVKRIR